MNNRTVSSESGFTDYGSSANILDAGAIKTAHGTFQYNNNTMDMETPGSNSNCFRKMKDSLCGNNTRWIFRFGMIFLISVIILCCVYGLKSTTSHEEHSQVVESAYAVGDSVYAGDLWVVIELESNVRGVRTALGKAVSGHVCSAIKASQALGWTPLVVGGSSRCCKSKCRHLHPHDLKLMKFETTSYFIEKYDFSSAMKAAAFLAAIKRGAKFIYHANPEVYYRHGVSKEQYQMQLMHQLKKTTLATSVGLVKSKELPGSVYFNPYSHFVPDIVNSTDKKMNRYKICETIPPSLEKFLDSDGHSMDMSAPSLMIPGRMSAPFDSRNTVFSRNAFWSLLVLPDINGKRRNRFENDRMIYQFRSILGQKILSETGGSTKFSAGQVATVDNLMSDSSHADMTEMDGIIEFVNTWHCSSSTAVGCVLDLGIALQTRGFLSKENLEVIELWTNDLEHIEYENVPAMGDKLAAHLPCIDNSALIGVYFYPSVIEARMSTAIEQPQRSLRRFGMSRRTNTLMMVQRLCPSVDLDYLHNSISNKFDKHENIVLIVTFASKEYEDLPLMEILYRHHFKNIIYCGEPDEQLEKYMDTKSARQGSKFSFLPAYHHTGYECLLGALEMGYHADGFLVVDQKTLINSWNFEELDSSTIWHGNEHSSNITIDTIQETGHDEKTITKNMKGVLDALNFLENILLGMNSTSEKQSLVRAGSSGLISFKRTLFKREADYENITETESDLFQDNLEDEFSVAAEFAEEDQLEYEGSADDVIPSADGAESNVTEPLDNESPSIFEELQDGVSSTNVVKPYHISLFGELTPEKDIEDSSGDGEFEEPSITFYETEVLLDISSSNSSDAHISDVLIKPANFLNVDDNDQEINTESEQVSVEPNPTDDFSQLMDQISRAFRNINEKLNLWMHLKKNYATMTPQEINEAKASLEHIQCDLHSNNEICHLVAIFFRTLESNQGDHFQLIYDDLPVYYVPAAYKEKLYLMANLFTKFNVADELAFPLLLRGLSHTSTWTQLKFSEMIQEDSTLSSPQDLWLLSEAAHEYHDKLSALEASHYLYPVDMKSVLTNNDLRSVICRNF